MNAIVVYESVYGNTHAIADAIAEGLGGVSLPLRDVGERAADADLLVLGGPTHMHAMATARSRHAAAAAAHEDGSSLDEHADDEHTLRTWLRDLPSAGGRRAAAFDTRLDRAPWLTGVAARGISRRLARRGYDVIALESFLVEDSEGPLAEGELERARAWGERLRNLRPAVAA